MRAKSIAHRGASAYAPEHTRASYRLAVEQGADYVEQDLGVTSDGVLICLHDDSLERTTNVAEAFPDRAVVDPVTGQWTWRAVDFTIAEISRLDAGSWFDPRFADERVLTWDDAVAIVGKDAGLYPELKSPERYRNLGFDPGSLFVESFERLGLGTRPEGALVLQSFDEIVLRQLANALPVIPRTFLVEVRDGSRRLTPEGLAQIAGFATGVGPDERLLDERADIVRAAHEAGLVVVPYTFSSRVPGRLPDVRSEMTYYLTDLGVDALFTDNPDLFPDEHA